MIGFRTEEGNEERELERENVRAWEWGHAKNACPVCLERESKREDRERIIVAWQVASGEGW
jgi:hypothetical protein